MTILYTNPCFNEVCYKGLYCNLSGLQSQLSGMCPQQNFKFRNDSRPLDKLTLV